jgi:hypothetical protein
VPQQTDEGSKAGVVLILVAAGWLVFLALAPFLLPDVHEPHNDTPRPDGGPVDAARGDAGDLFEP